MCFVHRCYLWATPPENITPMVTTQPPAFSAIDVSPCSINQLIELEPTILLSIVPISGVVGLWVYPHPLWITPIDSPLARSQVEVGSWRKHAKTPSWMPKKHATPKLNPRRSISYIQAWRATFNLRGFGWTNHIKPKPTLEGFHVIKLESRQFFGLQAFKSRQMVMKRPSHALWCILLGWNASETKTDHLVCATHIAVVNDFENCGAHTTCLKRKYWTFPLWLPVQAKDTGDICRFLALEMGKAMENQVTYY